MKKFLCALICFCSLNFNAKCVKFEIFHDHCSFILDDKNQTAMLNQVYVGCNEERDLIIPSFLEFFGAFYKVISLNSGTISPFVLERVNRVILSVSIDKNDEITKNELYKFLDSKKLDETDKYAIKDFFENTFDKELQIKKDNDPLKRSFSFWFHCLSNFLFYCYYQFLFFAS